MRFVVVILGALLAACEPAAAPSLPPSATPSGPVATQPSATASLPPALEETPRLLLSIPYAPPATEKLGATTTRVGGVTPRGPSSLAVDENDRIYIWDQARLRVVVYGGGKFERAILLPYVEQDAGALLVEGGRVYLRAVSPVGVLEYEIDGATGALLRAVSTAGDSIYPRRRAGPQPAAARYAFGADAAGLEYLYISFSPGMITRYERVASGRGTVAYAVDPRPQDMLDAYPRADGALYELAADHGGVGSVFVYALLAPAAAARPPTPPPVATASTAFGRAVPDRLTATLAQAGTIDLDAPSRAVIWSLASLAKERTDLAAAPQDPLFVARWNDGSRLEIVVSAGLLFAAGKTYLGPASSYEQYVAYALASPARLAALVADGASIRIADLGTQRPLTAAERVQLRDSLAGGFAVSEGELPFVLELPFPAYEIVLANAVVRLRGDEYGSLGRLGAFVHDGALDDLVRRWLPVPAVSIEDVRSLFFADKVTFEQRGYSDLQDISRWKASIVRALTASPGDAQSEPTGEPPATLVFRLPSGRMETVVVSRGSFTYRGRVIALPGVMYLVYYRGVP
jgi:hypothetical protein